MDACAHCVEKSEDKATIIMHEYKQITLNLILGRALTIHWCIF